MCYAGSFAGLGFLSLYMSGKIKAFDSRGHVAKLCLVFLPLLIASLVAISRVNDYWHHWQDVFAGGVIGMCLYGHLPMQKSKIWNLFTVYDLATFFNMVYLLQGSSWQRFAIDNSSHPLTTMMVYTHFLCFVFARIIVMEF